MVLCNRRGPLNTNTSSILDNETDTCGRPAKYKSGGPNRNFFYYCEEHRSALLNGEGWDKKIGESLIPLDGTEEDVDFPASGFPKQSGR